MARKTPKPRPDRQLKENPSPAGSDAASGSRKWTCTFSLPGICLVVVLSFAGGLLAGSFLSPAARQPLPAATQSAPAPQAQGPAQAASPGQESVPPELQARIASLEQTVLAQPGNREALVTLGDLYYDTRQPARAVQAYEAALALKGDDPAVLTDLGIMYRALGDFDKALDRFVKAQKASPGHPQSLFNQGVVLNYDLHRHEEALKVWRELLRLYPDAAGPDGVPLRKLVEELAAQTGK